MMFILWGVVNGAEMVSLGMVSGEDSNNGLTDSVNNRTTGLVAQLYKCSVEEVDSRIARIRQAAGDVD